MQKQIFKLQISRFAASIAIIFAVDVHAVT